MGSRKHTRLSDSDRTFAWSSQRSTPRLTPRIPPRDAVQGLTTQKRRRSARSRDQLSEMSGSLLPSHPGEPFQVLDRGGGPRGIPLKTASHPTRGYPPRLGLIHYPCLSPSGLGDVLGQAAAVSIPQSRAPRPRTLRDFPVGELSRLRRHPVLGPVHSISLHDSIRGLARATSDVKSPLP
jgi:hypothetical protein